MSTMRGFRPISLALICLVALVMLSGCISTRSTASGEDKLPVKVMVLATMHSRHADNPRYSYDDIYSLVATFNPHVLGVEIRAEDIDRGEDYLAANYPLEMRELARRYPNRTVGIDWLGEDLEDRPVPQDYWRSQSAITRLQRELAEDEQLSSARLEAARLGQVEILATATASSLNDGRYDTATAEYYATLARLLENTRFSELTDFYAERDQRIAENAAAAVASLKDARRDGGRILFVVGADHRGPVVEALRLRFEDDIQFVPVP